MYFPRLKLSVLLQVCAINIQFNQQRWHSFETPRNSKTVIFKHTTFLKNIMIRSTSGTSKLSSSENLPPRAIARVVREVRDLLQCPPEGTKLVLDSDTGLPSNLSELKVRILVSNFLCSRFSVQNNVETDIGKSIETRRFVPNFKLIFSMNSP